MMVEVDKSIKMFSSKSIYEKVYRQKILMSYECSYE